MADRSSMPSRPDCLLPDSTRTARYFLHSPRVRTRRSHRPSNAGSASPAPISGHASAARPHPLRSDQSQGVPGIRGGRQRQFALLDHLYLQQTLLGDGFGQPVLLPVVLGPRPPLHYHRRRLHLYQVFIGFSLQGHHAAVHSAGNVPPVGRRFAGPSWGAKPSPARPESPFPPPTRTSFCSTCRIAVAWYSRSA